jgi:hypothetical protein
MAQQDTAGELAVVLRVRDVRDGLALGEIGPLSVALWRGAVARESFNRQSAALRWVVESHPGTAGFLCIVEAGSTPPDEELRRDSARMITAHGDRLALVAAVIEGSGFQASLARSVLIGIAMLVPRDQIGTDLRSCDSSAAHSFDWRLRRWHTAPAHTRPRVPGQTGTDLRFRVDLGYSAHLRNRRGLNLAVDANDTDPRIEELQLAAIVG